MSGNHKGIHSKVILVGVFNQNFVDLSVDNNVHTVRGRNGLLILHPGSFNILLGELDLQLSDVAFADSQVSQRLNQGHGTH